MKKTVIALLVLVILLAGAWFLFFRPRPHIDTGTREQPLTVSQHSDTFNIAANKMISSYYELTEAFVVWDTAAVNKYSAALKTAVDSLRLSELQKDTVIYETAVSTRDNVKSEIDGLIDDKTLEEKRLAFNSLTQYIYDLLRTVRYDQSKIYFQECPMAFGEDQPGNWLSKTPAVRNPYLGTQHPKYKDKMLNCGSPKDTLNFMVAGSTK